MNGNQNKQSDLVDTTDCLEAIGVFRGWKNFLFIIVAACLFLLQVSFWLVDRGCISLGVCDKATDLAKNDIPIVTKEIKEAAKEAIAEPNQIAEFMAQEPQQEFDTPPDRSSEQLKEQTGSLFGITFGRLAGLIRFLNFVLILAAALYCLTMLFSIKISLIGRLGGINHICRAFFLSLVMLVLLLPWQNFFGCIVVGVIYTPDELVRWCTSGSEGIFDSIIHYLRFTGYWALVVLLLILSLLRSSRWTKAILRRLEVI